jgi:hypothetical protein
MARRLLPKVTLQAQLVAVRRAASQAALDCRPTARRPNVALATKQETRRDALAAAAVTLQQVAEAREALDMLPDVQRDKLAIALAAAGYRAVRIDGETDLPVEARHG